MVMLFTHKTGVLMKKFKFLFLFIFLVMTVSVAASSNTLKNAQNLVKAYADNQLESIQQLPIDRADQANLSQIVPTYSISIH